MNPVPSTGSERAPLDLREVVLLGLFTVAAMVFATAFDLDRIPVYRSDEIGHLNSALRGSGPVWNIYSFPIHTFTYRFMSIFDENPLRNYRLNAFIPFFLMLFLMQIYVLRCTRSILLAVLAAAPLLLASELGLSAWPHTNHTVGIVLLAGLLLMPARVTYGGLTCQVILLYVVMGFTRSEQILSLYLAFVIMAGWALLWIIKRRDWRVWLRTFLWPAGLAVGLLAGLTALLGPPILQDRYRSMAAFSQHFAYSLSLRGEVAEHPWLEDRAVLERFFGEANSLSEALLTNPGAMVDHVVANLGHVLTLIVSTDTVGGLAWIGALGLYVLCAFLFLRHLTDQWRQDRIEAADLRQLLLLIAPLPSLVLLVLIFPRANYLQMSYVIFVAAAVSVFMRLSLPAIMRSQRAPELATIAAIAVLALIQPLENKESPYARVIETLRADVGAPALSVAATTRICVFLTVPCEETIFDHTRDALADVLAAGAWDYIVVVKHPEYPERQEDLEADLTNWMQGAGKEAWRRLPAPDHWTVLRRSAEANSSGRPWP